MSANNKAVAYQSYKGLPMLAGLATVADATLTVSPLPGTVANNATSTYATPTIFL